MVLSVVVGLMPTAIAAAAEESEEDNLSLLHAQLSEALPEPIEGTDPLDPENPYPYGIPVDNFYPEELLAPNPYAISTMAAAGQGSIPDEMWDNSALRALQYTGYDVQWLKNNGWLYNAEYISSRLSANRPGVLSDIGYYSSGACPNGDETIADSTTVTGKAPNLSYFESRGMVCASFVTYYLCNYLPNIEGVNTSALYNKAKELGKEGNSYYLTTVTLWKNVLDSFASQQGSGVTKYTNAQEAYANLVPGDIIVFARNGSLVHIALYAGAYILYSDGYNAGLYHFTIHVGNSRGPEISTVEYTATSGSKASTPIAWYHLDLNDAVEATGFIEVNKEDESGNALAGAYFTAVEKTTGEKYVIGPTNASGYAKSPEMPFGTYTVTETKFPEGYEASGTTSWTVTLDANTSEGVITINAVNKLKTGVAKIVKQATNGGSVAGWHFTVKNSAGTVIGNYTTDSSGVIAIDLVPGTYTVTETDGSYDYWRNDPTKSRTVTVTAGGTATVTFTNEWIGKLEIQKQLADPSSGSLEGWTFQVYSGTVVDASALIDTVTSGQDGCFTLDLNPGSYTVLEVLPEDSMYVCTDENPQTVTVEAGQTATVTFTNALRSGEIEVNKQDPAGNSLADAEFLLEWSEDGINWMPVFSSAAAVKGSCSSAALSAGKLLTGGDGRAVFSGLYPDLNYRLTELKAPDGYQLLSNAVYLGELSQAVDARLSLTVVNVPVFVLPATGAKSMVMLPLSILVCMAVCGLLLWKAGKKR